MDELLKMFEFGESVTPILTVWSVFFACLLSALLSMFIGLVYRFVHGEASYSQSFVHTLILLSMVTALIMLIIGSNIARAFSLVGALSVIRFRSAIKSPLDVGFLFFTMAVGMACGTRFYAVASVATLMICGIMILLKLSNFASHPPRREYLLSIVFHTPVDYERLIHELFPQFFQAYSLAYVETIRQGALREVVYSVQAKPGIDDKVLLDAISKINDNLKINYRSIRHAIEIP
jgi:hypothetical protein